MSRGTPRMYRRCEWCGDRHSALLTCDPERAARGEWCSNCGYYHKWDNRRPVFCRGTPPKPGVSPAVRNAAYASVLLAIVVALFALHYFSGPGGGSAEAVTIEGVSDE